LSSATRTDMHAQRHTSNATSRKRLHGTIYEAYDVNNLHKVV